MNKLLQLTAEVRQIMRGWCEICLQRKARIFMVVVEDRLVAKAHICAKCFAAIQEETTGEIRSVSHEEYTKTKESFCSRADLN